MKLALLIEEAAGSRLLRWLLKQSGYEIVYVLCRPAAPNESTPSLWTVAQGKGLNVLPAATIKEAAFGERMRADGIDILLSLRSPFIIPPAAFEAPRIGAYNLHTGPLPAYAGRNVINWGIYNGESNFGVTLHEIVEAVDAGRVAYRAEFPIAADCTAFQLTNTCIQQGVKLVQQLLGQAMEDPAGIPALPQTGSERHYYKGGPSLEGLVDWSAPAEKLHNLVRACSYHPFPSPWGYPNAVLSGRKVSVLTTALTGEPVTAGIPSGTMRREDDVLLVACADNWLQLCELLSQGEVFAANRLPDIQHK